MSFPRSLPRAEIINIALVTVAALIVGIGSIILRLSLPRFPLVMNLRDTEYTLGFILLGMLPLLWIVSTKNQTRVAAFFLAIATSGGLLLPPGSTELELAWNAALAGAIALMGTVYYRLNDNVSHVPVLGFIGVLILNFYLYGTYYLIRSFMLTQDLRLLLGVLALTAMLFGLTRILYAEYQNVSGGGFSFD